MAITIERQVPERGQRGGAAAPAGQCCCCCCCCLHTLGGVLGAVTAGPPRVEPDQVPRSAIQGPTLEPRYSAAGLYWGLSLLMCGVASGWFVAAERHESNFAEILLLLAMTLPGVQLAASLVAAIAISLSTRVGKEVRMRHLGRITLRAVLGALAGGLVLLLLFSVC